MLFFIGIGIMAIGALIIAFMLLKIWFKFTARSTKGLFNELGKIFYEIYDDKFVKDKSIPYQSDYEKRQEKQRQYVANEHNKERAKEYLGAVSFVDTLRQKYSNADERIFENMVDKLLQSENPKDFERLEDRVRKSHKANSTINIK